MKEPPQLKPAAAKPLSPNPPEPEGAGEVVGEEPLGMGLCVRICSGSLDKDIQEGAQKGQNWAVDRYNNHTQYLEGRCPLGWGTTVHKPKHWYDLRNEKDLKSQWRRFCGWPRLYENPKSYGLPQDVIKKIKEFLCYEGRTDWDFAAPRQLSIFIPLGAQPNGKNVELDGPRAKGTGANGLDREEYEEDGPI